MSADYENFRDADSDCFEFDKYEVLYDLWSRDNRDPDPEPACKCLACGKPARMYDYKAWGTEMTGPYGHVDIVCYHCKTFCQYVQDEN